MSDLAAMVGQLDELTDQVKDDGTNMSEDARDVIRGLIEVSRVMITHMGSEEKTGQRVRVKEVEYTTANAATYLGCSVATVRRWADLGHLKVHRTPGGQRRFKQVDLDAFLRGREEATDPKLQDSGKLYLMIVGDERKWLGLHAAGVIYDAGSVSVGIGGLVIEDNSERDITEIERTMIAEIAEEYSASK